MQHTLVVIAMMLVSCGGQDSQVSRITGRWRAAGTGLTENVVELRLDPGDQTVTGLGDINSVTYDLEGHWEGAPEPNDVFDLDITVTVVNNGIKGTGTLTTGGEVEDVSVTGSRIGRSFRLTVDSEGGETMKVSGRLAYDYKEFRLVAEIENIPSGVPGGVSRNVELTIDGTARGGWLDPFRLGAAPAKGTREG